MKRVVGISLILLVCSVRGYNKVCEATARCNNPCENPTDTLTNVTLEEPFFYSQTCVIELDDDIAIGPNALSTWNPRFVRFELPYRTRHNKSALHTLTLYYDSFGGLSNVSSIIITFANINLCGNTLTSITNLERFEFAYCGFTEVPTEMLESTPNLVTLSFESNNIHIIRPNAFLPVKSLRELRLDGNGIIALELGCFNGLDNLKKLYLYNNHFKAVPGIFNGLTKLEYLHLRHAFDDNGFNVNILQTLPTITKLIMGNNKITSLEPAMFNIVPQLVSLLFDANKITSIPKSVFNKLKSLKVLYLEDNRIKTIEPGAFSGLNMHLLDLSHNEVNKTIETGTFSNLITDTLDLSRSNIIQLKARAFDGLSAKELNLRENKLDRIGAEDFLGLETDELDLSDNKIGTIATNAFQNTTVKRLHLVGNPINMGDKGNWGLPESTEILVKSQWDIQNRPEGI